MIVNNYYTRNSSEENTVVTVSKPAYQFITGGGYLVLTNSAGLVAGELGTKNNFGFNLKYEEGNTNLQGNINSIVRSGGRVYQINGNAMTSLAVALSTVGGNATFKGGANIQDITNPLLPVGVESNATVQVAIADRGEPGTADSIGISVWKQNGDLWFSSRWTGTKTAAQVLGGGNTQVRGGARVSAPAGGSERDPSALAEDRDRPFIPADFGLSRATPNPFSLSTRLLFGLPERSQVSLVIYDVTGRQVASLVDVAMEPGNHSISWAGRGDGGRFAEAGVYFLRMRATSLTSARAYQTDRRIVLVR